MKEPVVHKRRYRLISDTSCGLIGVSHKLSVLPWKHVTCKNCLRARRKQ